MHATLSPQEPARHAFVFGAGYVGRLLVKRLLAAPGREGTPGSGSALASLWATTRTENSAAALRKLAEDKSKTTATDTPSLYLPGFPGAGVDVSRAVTLAALPKGFDGPVDVCWLVPPGKAPLDVLVKGQQAVLKAMRGWPIRRAVWVSSSAVYGDQGGAVVDADSPPNPDAPRAQALLDAENRWLDAGDGFCVLRLAGLYGTGRVPGAKPVQQQAPLLGDPEAWINLIHADDAAALVQAMWQAESPGRIELGCDGQPLKRLAYYEHVAACLGVPAPKPMAAPVAAITLGLDANRLAKTSSKALSNTPTMERTGWQPQHPDARPAIAAILGQAR